jgi:hypothetical protein
MDGVALVIALVLLAAFLGWTMRGALAGRDRGSLAEDGLPESRMGEGGPGGYGDSWGGGGDLGGGGGGGGGDSG